MSKWSERSTSLARSSSDHEPEYQLFVVHRGLALLSQSCSRDPRAAAEANFKAAIQTRLDREPDCISVGLPSERPDFQGRSPPDPELEALVRVGVVSRATTLVQPPFNTWVPGESQRKLPDIRYDFTVKGRNYVPANSRPMMAVMWPPSYKLCYGTPQMQNIVRFSEPAALMGQIVTEVTYTYRLRDVAPWALDPGVDQAFHIAALN